GVDRVGIHDAFFDLGGHSLKATQILSRLRQSFDVEVPLDRIFERPTVAGLAALIEECRQAGRNLPPIERIPRDPPPKLSFAQQRLWFLDQLEPSSAYNIPAAVRIRGDLDPAVVERCIAALVARHETLRTTFALIEGTPRQIVHPPEAWKIPVIRLDLSDLPEGEREQEAFAHAHAAAAKRFDLSEGPLLRVLLIRIDTSDHLLVLNMHHIVSDGWSLGVLIRELATLYPAGGDPSLLPPLPIQYADHAAWQRKVLAGETSDRLLAYWRKRLEGAPETLPLPTDKPRPAVQTFNGAVRLRRLAAPLLRQLEELSRQQEATLFMTLLAAFDVLLYRYSGASDIVVGTPISGRNRSEIEGLIGFFVNTLPLRADLSGNPPFTDLLRQVRERALEAYRHQDLPFERLIEALDLSRALSHSPLFQVMFILQNPLPPLEVPGLSFEPVPVESGGAKFDLTLSVAQGPHGN
ncbi:MAG: non-ribosomal peptide synthetase, partial [Deltaproteobacteria bacterium]